MNHNDTSGARQYAADMKNNVSDVEAHWWKFFSGYRVKQWRLEIRKCLESTGRTVREICEDTDLAYSDDATFFARLPRRRDSYIGIGMALDQPLETINRWITKYGEKRALYAKDISEDLVWIYLIEANCADPQHTRNYFRMHEECADAVYRTYCALWQDYIEHDEGTNQVLKELREVSFDEGFEGLTEFVADHMDAFKTAYAWPRRMLEEYVQLLLKYTGRTVGTGSQSLTVLRGYLDDSMINYLSGDPGTIHTLERRSDRHSLSFKHIPKGRRAHISLALALGMTTEIDQYLQLMGFAPLDAVRQDEGILISAIEKWEKAHPQQRRLKQMELEGDSSVGMTEEESREALEEMLRMRQDIGEVFAGINKPYPYLKK